MSKTDQFMSKGLARTEGDLSLTPGKAVPDDKQSSPQWGATAGGWAQTTVTRDPNK